MGIRLQPDEAIQPSFRFDRFVVDRMSMEHVPQQPMAEGEIKPTGGISCDVRPRGQLVFNDEGNRARLSLGFVFTPDPKFQPYRIEVDVVGVFSMAEGTHEQFIQFCQNGAAPILFPFVRELVYQLTRDARHNPVRLDPINVQAMLKWDVSETATSTAPAQPSEQSPSASQE